SRSFRRAMQRIITFSRKISRAVPSVAMRKMEFSSLPGCDGGAADVLLLVSFSFVSALVAGPVADPSATLVASGFPVGSTEAEPDEEPPEPVLLTLGVRRRVGELVPAYTA